MTHQGKDMAEDTVIVHPFSRIDVWNPKLVMGKRGFKTAEELLEAATEYFQHCVNNPVEEHVLFHHRGDVTDGYLKKIRPFTITGLCVYAGMSRSTYEKYRRERGPEFTEATELIDTVVETQKLEGAMMNIFNGNVVSRHLNLAERHELSGPNGEPIKTITGEMTHQEAAEAYAATLDNK